LRRASCSDLLPLLPSSIVLSPQQQEEIRNRLRAEQDNLRRRLARIEDIESERRRAAAERAPCSYLDATRDAEISRDPELMRVDTLSSELRQVERATSRLLDDPERFGFCSSCGDMIPFERLCLIPHATHCVDCGEIE